MRAISPSLLSADFGNLQRDCEMINQSSAEYLHIDVMDGVFVNNITFGIKMVEDLRKITKLPLDCHLMIVHPEKYVERFVDAGAFSVGFHLEAVEDPRPILKLIRDKGAKTCLTINPDIPVSRLFPYLDQCDYIVLMSVFAGFGGQKFIEATYDRLAAVKDEVRRQGVDCLIQVDGGVSAVNAAKLVENGADILVAGSAVFKAADPAEVISAMRI